METFSALLAFCVEKLPIIGEFPAQRLVKRNFDVFFDLNLNQQLSQQWRRRWFETPSRSLWRHCNVISDTKIVNPNLAPSMLVSYWTLAYGIVAPVALLYLLFSHINTSVFIRPKNISNADLKKIEINTANELACLMCFRTIRIIIQR